MKAIWRRHGRRTRRADRAAAIYALAGAVLAAVAVLTPAPAAAQAALRLGDAYRELDARSPRIGAARALASAANATVRSASLPPDPQLQLGFMNYTVPGLTAMPPLGMVQVQVMQMVPLPGKLALAGSAARAEARAADGRADAATWTARLELATAFYDLYQIDAQLAVARRTIALLGDIEQTAEAMYRVGQAGQPDVLRAQVELARMTEDTLRMVAMRTGAAARFDAALDVAADSMPGTPQLPAFPDAVPAEDSLMTLALQMRPSVRAGRSAVTAADDRRKLAQRDVWPDLAVGVQLGRRPNGGSTMGSLMVGASIPIFVRSRQDAETQAAAAMTQMSAADLRATEADTRAQILAAYADLLRARRLTALYRHTVLPEAEAAATSALASYRVGHVDFMTVLDDRLTVDQYERALHQLEADEGTAWARLEALVARPLINANSTAAPASGGDQ
ncbi:MAG: TolC family protein [Gemmatimonadota bacterium]|nr:TolC family protein [Gemmatimonadota bacterium]